MRGDRPFNSWDAAKLIGLALMLVDHVGAFLYPDQLWMRAIGRAAPPVFLFLAGFSDSWRLRPDVLLLGMIVSASNMMMAGHPAVLNILLTILLARLILRSIDRSGKPIARPWEWVIGAVALFPNILFFQYGTTGLLFALIAYMKRRPEQYPPERQRRLRATVFVIYGTIEAYAAGFAYGETLLMALALACVYVMLEKLEVRPLAAPQPWRAAGKFLSRYSLYIYAVHLLALQWMTGVAY